MSSGIIRSKLILLRKSGELSFYGQKINIAKTFQTPEIKKSAKSVKTLTLTRTSFSSAKDFPEMPYCTTINADNSNLENFANFLVFPKLAKISIKKTPISEKKHYKLSLYLLFGESLSSINGAVVPELVRERASEYPAFAQDLVNKGWIATYPPPSDEEFESLCSEFDVKKEDSGVEGSNSIVDDNDIEYSDEEEDADFEYIVQELRDRQEEQLKETADYLEFEEEEIEEEEEDNDEIFAYQVASLFIEHGIEVGAYENKDILMAVENLCQKAAPQQ